MTSRRERSRRSARCACRGAARRRRSSDGDVRRTRSRDPSHPTGQALCVKGKAAPDDREPSPTGCCTRCGARTRRAPPTRAGSASAGTRRSTRSPTGCVRSPRDHGPESVVFGSRLAVDVGDRRLASTGSSGCGARSAARTCHVAWSCAAGAATWRRCTPSARRCRAATCPTSTAPAASCSGATTRRSPGSRTPRRRSPRCAAARELVVVDPRRAGLATKADHWLRVRPGTDAALALALTHVMIERGWLRRGLRPPLDQRAAPRPRRHRPPAARRATSPTTATRRTTSPGTRSPARPVDLRPGARPVRDRRGRGSRSPARYEVATAGGPVTCRPAFDLVAEQCRAMQPTVAEEITGVPAAEIERAARRSGSHRPLAFYTWSGLEQHSGTTQIIRAINVLYALTRLPRRARRQRAVHPRADQPDRRRRAARTRRSAPRRSA